MALEDLLFFFERCGAHISFLQGAIPQKRPLRQNKRWLLTILYCWGPLVGARHRTNCQDRVSAGHRREIYLKWNFSKMLALTIAPGQYVRPRMRRFARFNNCTHDRWGGGL